jgi:NTP pyrophosphatase (non-canonical NTP hydrolase)
MNDKNTKISRLKTLVGRFVRERDWESFHSPKNLAMSISIEAAELMEIFQWFDTKEAAGLLDKPEKAEHIREELADILIYLISFCNLYKIDLTGIVTDKLRKNKARFPAKQVRGAFLKRYR